MSEDTPTYGASAKADAVMKEHLSSEMGWGLWVIDIAIRAKFRCEYCDRDLLSSVDAYKEWQHDHIIPQRVDTNADKDRLENMALSCRTCNVNFKGKWDPSHGFDGEPTRDELIQISRRYVARKRTEAFAEVLKARQIVCGG